MNTSYDEIWESFLENCSYDSSEIPQTDERRYSMIKNAIRYYNQKAKKYEGRIQGNLVCDDMMEELNVKLNSIELLILANVLGYIFCKNKLVEFTSIYGTFAKEMGFKDYKAQVEGRQAEVNRYEEEVSRLIQDEIDSFNL